MGISTVKTAATTSLLGKVSLLIAVYMAVAAVGAYEGVGITGGWSIFGIFLGAIVCILGMYITVERWILLGLGFAVGLAYLLGLCIAPLLASKIHDLGWEPVAMAFGGSSVAMLGFGGYGYLSNRDFSGWGPGLLYALFGLIGAGFICSFMVTAPFWHVVYGFAGMILFSGYFIYDANKLKRTDNTWASAVPASVNLFLDFGNFFEEWLITK